MSEVRSQHITQHTGNEEAKNQRTLVCVVYVVSNNKFCNEWHEDVGRREVFELQMCVDNTREREKNFTILMVWILNYVNLRFIVG